MQKRACVWMIAFGAPAWFAGSVWAQAPTAPGSSAPPKPAVGASEPQVAESTKGEPYTYTPDGRRDPFVSLLSRGVEPSPQAKSSTNGIRGLTTAEVSVRGVVQSRGVFVAMVQAPDSKTYLVHANDRFIDGIVTQVTPQGIVVLQEVNDPLSLVKQREVRKNLRSAEEGK